MFARQDVDQQVTLISTSETADRVCWHTPTAPFLVCAWHRPPAPWDASQVLTFTKEWAELKHHALGTLAVADLNLHQQRWLRHSQGNSREGNAMQAFCDENGFAQLAREPTRGHILLDLVLSDMPDWHCRVLPQLADHSVVASTATLRLPSTAEHSRSVWVFQKADWERLHADLEATDWSCLSTSSTTDGARHLTQRLLEIAGESLPTR